MTLSEESITVKLCLFVRFRFETSLNDEDIHLPHFSFLSQILLLLFKTI